MNELTLQELALHMGCECEYEYRQNYRDDWRKEQGVINIDLLALTKDGGILNIRNIRPILRPLSDITEAEAREFLKEYSPHLNYASHGPLDALLSTRNVYGSHGSFAPVETLWLARHGFDVLGLLGDNRAILKTKQEAL